MDRPQPRIIRLELQLATYLGDWMAHYEKAIQTLAQQELTTVKTNSNTQTTQEQPRVSQ